MFFPFRIKNNPFMQQNNPSITVIDGLPDGRFSVGWVKGLRVLHRRWDAIYGPKMLIGFVLMRLAEFVFNCLGHEADRIQ